MSTLHDLRRALELAHYANLHRGSLLVAALGGHLHVADFLLDLRLLGAYGLRAVMVVRAADGAAGPLVAGAQGPGAGFRPLDGAAPLDELVDQVRAALAEGVVPVVVAPDPVGDDVPGPAKRLAARLAHALSARRLLLVQSEEGHLELGPHPIHLTVAEARRRAAAAEGAAGLLWDFLVQQADGGLPGVVVLPPRPGCIFDELFTHAGGGLLVADSLVEQVRPATLADSAHLHLLLKSDIARGTIRPVSEVEMVRTAPDHLVYTIDGLVVGTARLAPYGDWAELSRFATLPRYRGRGRARALGLALIDLARTRGFTDLFALSVDSRMWRFFESLGFEATERERLPEAWRAGYDFSRPSRAFHRAV